MRSSLSRHAVENTALTFSYFDGVLKNSFWEYEFDQRVFLLYQNLGDVQKVMLGILFANENVFYNSIYFNITPGEIDFCFAMEKKFGIRLFGVREVDNNKI